MRLSHLFAAAALLSTAAADNDAEYTKKIREYTTEPFFLTELVDYLPASTTVPSPEKVLGYVIGTPNKLTYSADTARYFRAVAAATPRVQVFSMGKSEEGREMVVAVVSNEENLANLNKYKEITALLGDPRKIDESKAQTLIAEGLPIYWATGAMHSTESGSPEMLMELLYRLAVDESPFIQQIRKNSIVMLTPVLETDGRDRYVDTYYWRKKNPDKPPIPLVYWGHYVAHDNNRDGMAISLAMSKNLMRTWFDFHPQVLHDLHESVPYLYISTGTGPYNAWLDPIVVDEWHLMAYNEVGEMTRRGVPGVWTHGFYDGWAPNYAFYAANGHNAIGRFYETFGGSGADTGIRSAGNTTRDWFRPNPPFARVRWSIRNNINLQQSALLLGLNFVATNKERFLRNYYLKSKRSTLKARTEGPAAYVLPAGEPRKGQQKALLEMLARQGIEVMRLKENVKTEDGEFAKGSFVVRMDQPYSRMADMLLDKQYYSPNDPSPYDDTGWTLGPLFNVATVRCKDVSILDKQMEETKDFDTKTNVSFTSKTRAFLIENDGDFSLAQLRYRIPKAQMLLARESFTVNATEYKAGTVIIGAAGNGISDAAHALSALGISAVAVDEVPKTETREIRAARIALVHTWTSTQNEGWYRIALDQLGIPYRYVSVHELRDNADLRAKFDAIILPPGGGSAQSIVNGMQGDGPIPWKAMPDFKHLGGPDSSDDIRGGIELQGVLNLQRFLRNGGCLITITNTCAIPIDYGLVSGVSIVQPRDLRAPGGVYLAERADDSSPVLAGYGGQLGVYFSGAPLLSLGGGGFGGRGFQGGSGRPSGRGGPNEPDIIQGRAPYTPERRDDDENETPQQSQSPRPRVLLRFAGENELLISGMLAGGSELAGKSAVIECPVGAGRVVMFAINPMWRMQTHGSYQLLFNACMIK